MTVLSTWKTSYKHVYKVTSEQVCGNNAELFILQGTLSGDPPMAGMFSLLADQQVFQTQAEL